MLQPRRTYEGSLLRTAFLLVSSWSPRHCYSLSVPLWDRLATEVAQVLVCSDNKRDTTGYDGASTGWTAWVDAPSEAQLSTAIEGVRLGIPVSPWLRSCPAPVVVDLSPQFRASVIEQLPRILLEASVEGSADTSSIRSQNGEVSGGLTVSTRADEEEEGDPTMDPTLPLRIGLRLIHLPSGSSLSEPLTAPPGALVYGVALDGGITRFRFLGSKKQRRRAGERTVVTGVDATLSWLQYGGPARNYQAVDMGPGLLLEIILLPAGLEMPLLSSEEPSGAGGDMALTSTEQFWNPRKALVFGEEVSEDPMGASQPSTSSIPESVYDLGTSFRSSLGGLQPQIDEIIRRVLDGRVFRGVNELNTTDTLDRTRRDEMVGLLELGLHPVKGLLLYGPPGCGKTKLAREISTLLDSRPPKIVAAPDLLDRWVGGTEQMVRSLFEDAEQELHQVCGGDATKSGLHVIVVDEIDAVFRKRSSADSTSEVTRASAVNQILSKLDGVNALDNILFIGMTNRRELLDPALLRPGRLEAQVEIPLPSMDGRREILRILFAELRKGGRLSKNLCDAIDGVHRKRGTRLSTFDLAASKQTGGFSGADLAGLVRNAGSIALDRCRKQGNSGIGGLIITLEDTIVALGEVKETKVLS